MRRGTIWIALALGWLMPLSAQAQTVLWMDGDWERAVALERELSRTGMEAFRVDPPTGPSSAWRAVSARAQADARGAEVAIWLEPDGRLHAIRVADGAHVDAAMPPRADARVAAIVAARLVDSMEPLGHLGRELDAPATVTPEAEVEPPAPLREARGPLRGGFVELGWSTALMANQGLVGVGFFPWPSLRVEARARGGAVFDPTMRGSAMLTGGLTYAADRRQGRFEAGLEGGYGFLGPGQREADGYHLGLLGASFGFAFTANDLEVGVRFTAYVATDGALTFPFALGDLVVRVFP
ncbi:MAG: hypothetical protein VYE22_15425 [Myxococcota bacterium]|nr:hypothetical protein [Myxococcota bacterium]